MDVVYVIKFMQQVFYFKSSLGRVKVALSGKFITELCFTTQVRGGFTEIKSKNLMYVIKLQLKDYFEGTRKNFSLPWRVEGTIFQERVWKAVRDVKYGKTASYLEIAKKIGRPQAVRAVAQAVANNKIALLIPCHRIIRSTGELGGYAWGASVKRALLEMESAYKL